MAETKQIPRERWESYFEGFTKQYLMPDPSRHAADIEVLSPELGDQVTASIAHLIGITYDPKENALELEVDSGDQRVYRPQEIWTVEEPSGFVSALEIVGPDNRRDIVTMRPVGLQKRE